MNTIVTVFGNETEPNDSIALEIVPKLKMRFPTITFVIQDPTESIEPAGNPWIILDTAIGIDHVELVESLDDLEQVKGSSVHDFDVYMELRLQAKLKPLPKLKIILVPQGDNLEHAVEHVEEILRDLNGRKI
jgi:hypothetical protein